MTSSANYRFYDTIADLKAHDTPCDGEWARVDGYHAAGDGGGGWLRFDTASIAPADDGLVFEHATVSGRYLRIVNEGTYNARWWGAKGNGTGNDQPHLNTAAAAAQRDGIALRIPAGQYRVQPNTPTGRIIEITSQNFRVFGDGASVTSIEIGGSAAREDVGGVDYSNYLGFFVVDDYDTDASGFHLSDLTLNANYDANIITSEDQLKQGKRRGGVEIRNGTGITVERCRFLDFPRQCVFIVSDGPNRQVSGVRILHNECRIVTDSTGEPDGMGGNVSFDLTAIMIRADGALIEGNRIIGNSTNYYLSRTAVLGVGNDVRILANAIFRFHRGILVGTGEGDPQLATGITVIGNTMRDMNGGIEINVQTGQSHADAEIDGYALRNCIVEGNSIHLNKADYRISSTDELLYGVFLRTGNDTDVDDEGTITGNYAVDGLRITNNEIHSVPTSFEAGTALIEMTSNLSEKELTTPNRNWTIANNTLSSPPLRGIMMEAGPLQNATISGNLIVDLGQRAATPGKELTQYSGVRYIGTASDIAVRINGNRIVDQRATTVTRAGVYASGNGCDDLECLDNHVVLADARDIPVVETTSSNTTPFIRARTGKMTFEQPTEACRYGSTVIDEANGETWMQEASPSGTNWVAQ
jgi:hypothetical protein